MHFNSLDIPCAGTWKRDCELRSLVAHPKLCLEFEKDEDQTKWKIEFETYVALKVTSEEFSGHLMSLAPTKGAFYTFKNSPWIKELKRSEEDELLDSYKHFVLFFYDDVVEVVARELIYAKI